MHLTRVQIVFTLSHNGFHCCLYGEKLIYYRCAEGGRAYLAVDVGVGVKVPTSCNIKHKKDILFSQILSENVLYHILQFIHLKEEQLQC